MIKIKHKYLLERTELIPLCAYDGENYIDYLTGDVIINPKTLDFIENGIKSKTIYVKEFNFVIFRIMCKNQLIGYEYSIDDSVIFFDINKREFPMSKLYSYLEKLKTGEFTKELIWGDMI